MSEVGSLKIEDLKIAQKSLSALYLYNWGTYQQSEKTLNSNISSRCPPQYGKLRPTNGWDRFGSLVHPSKFQRVSRLGFVTAAASLTGGQPNFARCLAVSCAATLYIHFGDFAWCNIHFAPKSCFVLYWQHYCTALQQRASAKLCGVVQGMELPDFCRRRHLQSAGRPSRCASAHVLVQVCIKDLWLWIRNRKVAFDKLAIIFRVTIVLFAFECTVRKGT